jgi:hypothetical protein
LINTPERGLPNASVTLPLMVTDGVCACNADPKKQISKNASSRIVLIVIVDVCCMYVSL